MRDVPRRARRWLCWQLGRGAAERGSPGVGRALRYREGRSGVTQVGNEGLATVAAKVARIDALARWSAHRDGFASLGH